MAVVIDLALKMIHARVLKPEDITILICYRAQWKVYRNVKIQIGVQEGGILVGRIDSIETQSLQIFPL